MLCDLSGDKTVPQQRIKHQKSEKRLLNKALNYTFVLAFCLNSGV